ncbi:zinc-binding dehydrogenase [Kitasatospora sp. NPDC002543]
MSALPATTREVRLARRPAGLPRSSDFDVAEVPLSLPTAEQALVRTTYFRVTASLRMMIGEGAESVEGVPFPVLRPGDPVAGGALGEVVIAPEGSGLKPGDLVAHGAGWREYALVPAAELSPLDPATDPAVHLGHGWTAYAALTRAAGIRPGDTVHVTGATGAIGSVAALAARRLGAARVVGGTGSAAKTEALISGCEYDAVVTVGSGSLTDKLAAAAPGGLDVVLDTVGGDRLAAAVRAARTGARIVVIGALSGQLAPNGPGRSAPVSLDSFRLLLKKVTLRGYSADDHPEAEQEWLDLLDGATVPHHVVAGIEHAPQALVDTIAGRYLGPVLVKPF